MKFACPALPWLPSDQVTLTATALANVQTFDVAPYFDDFACEFVTGD
jgi:hypothetical protein|tara:strand:- start:106 stop:246 length:141 start_codon:yes stop_codon:yes gene_type:complete